MADSVRKHAAAASARERAMKPSIESAYALSPLQEGMLFHALAEPTSGAYCNQTALLIQGPFDRAAFEDAWRQLTDRHAVLRTAFAWKRQRRPLQLVWSRVELPLQLLDWSGEAPGTTTPGPSDWESRARAFLERDQLAGFDLARAPLFRLHLVRLPGDRHLFAMTHHHILMDGWSSTRLRAELLELMRARMQGEAPKLSPAPAFAGYIQWLSRRSPEASEDFFRRALAGFTEPTPIADSSARRPSGRAGHSGLLRALGTETSAKLRQLAERNGLTRGTVLAGAWALVLSRATAREDVLFGLTVSGRPSELPGAEDMVGLFINTVPLRARCPSSAPVIGWLRELQRQRIEAESHDVTPLSRIHAVSELTSSQSLFDHALIIENYARPRAGASTDPHTGEGGVTAFRHHQPTHFALTLYVLPRAGHELDLELRFDPDRISHGYAESLIGSWHAVIEQLCNLGDSLDVSESERAAARAGSTASAPPGSSRLAQIGLLSPDQRLRAFDRAGSPQPLGGRWVQGSEEAPVQAGSPASLSARFRAVAATFPEQLAIIDGDLRWSYAHLALQVEHAARALAESGARPHDRVGVCLPRSARAVVSILACWRIGAAYVPLDPRDPAERLAWMIDHAGIGFVFSDADARKQLPAETTLLDAAAFDNAAAPPDPAPASPPACRCADTVAYIMYTSGTTGRPKGIPVPQHAVIALADAGIIATGPGEVISHAANLTFDTSGFELWTALLHGGTVCILDPETLLSTSALRAKIEAERIRSTLLTPAVFNQHIDADPEVFAHVAHVVVGGEASDAAHVRAALQSTAPAAALINVYGPTEATIWATAARLDIPASDTEPVSIGRALPGWEAHVLDSAGQPLPAEIPGMLYLGGVGLAHGYHRAPRQTAQGFIPHPASTSPGARLYATGDRVLCRSDGELAFLGRSDDQVKIRGFRIEPAEIEAACRDCPGVSDARVLARPSPNGDPRLVAYYVGDPEAEPTTPGRIASTLAERLPSFMLPSAIVPLEAFPLTSRGKLDRRALPVPEAVNADARLGGDTRNGLEQLIADIWSELLAVPELGIHDDFFELGGHSLLAVQVVERLRSSVGLAAELPLTVLFDTPTIAQLAQRMTGAAARADSPLVLLRGASQGTPLYCLHPAGGHLTGYRTLATRLRGGPILGLQSRALFDPARRAESIEELASDYARLIQQETPSGPVRLLGWSLGGMIALALAEELERLGREIEFLGLIDAPLPRATRTDARATAAGAADRSSSPPHVAEEPPPRDEVERIARMLGASPEDPAVLELAPEARQQLERELSRLPDDDARLEAALAFAHAHGLLPRSVSLEVCRLRNEALDHARLLLDQHVARPVRTRIHAWLAGAGDPPIEPAREAWRCLSNSEPVIQVVCETDHRSIMESATLARSIQGALSEPRGAGDGGRRRGEVSWP